VTPSPPSAVFFFSGLPCCDGAPTTTTFNKTAGGMVVPRNFFHNGSIYVIVFGNLLRRGVLSGFKHPNAPVAVALTEL
jgi:hypothetical protein